MAIALRALALVLPLGLGIAAACSSGVSRKAARGAAGAGGEDSEQLGGAASGGQRAASGGEPQTGQGGADGGQAGAGNASGTDGGALGIGGEADAGQANGGAGGSDDGLGPTVVSSYGCFALSGDGSEIQVNGEPGVVVTSSPHGAACEGSDWVSDNENAYSPMQVPTTLRFRRRFVLAQAVTDGVVSISFKADDAVSFVLNGQAIGACEPTEGNMGLCQQECTKLPLSAGVLLDQQTNVLDIELTNLQSADAGNGNFGWTAVSYALCVAPPS